MSTDTQLLRKIYAKTDGYCHVCHKKLSFDNYDLRGQKGAWHIDHSVPKAKGGSDHLNNLFAACIGCNLEKGTLTSRTARNYYGNKRAPYSKEKKIKIKEDNTAAGAMIGGLVGLVAGPVGAVVGAAVGGFIGSSSSPKK